MEVLGATVMDSSSRSASWRLKRLIDPDSPDRETRGKKIPLAESTEDTERDALFSFVRENPEQRKSCLSPRPLRAL
jgi:hypothetical protein